MKIKTKFLLVCGIILSAVLLLNINKTYAASTIIQSEITDLSILNNLPDTITLEEKESEFEEAEQVILNKVIEEFEKKNIVIRRI